MKLKLGLAVLALAMLVAGNAFAVKVAAGDDAFVNVNVLVQAWGIANTSYGPMAKLSDPNIGGKVGTDFYLRRARLLLFGQVNKEISFFVVTDSPNYGKREAKTASSTGAPDFSGRQYIQDAFMSFKLMPELSIDAGLIIIPLTHHSIQSAASLNTLDYHSMIVRYPAGSTTVWRDTGIQFRGFVAEKIHYRLGIFGGVRGNIGRSSTSTATPPVVTALPSYNPGGAPRVAAMVRYNIFDVEDGFFPAGTYLGKKKVISIGVGGDWQNNVVLNTFPGQGTRSVPYAAVGGDVFVSYPLDESSELTFQTNVVNYMVGDDSPASGLALFAEAGYRMGKWEPVVGFEKFISKVEFKEADAAAGTPRVYGANTQALHIGLNYWLNGHTANIKADLALDADENISRAAGFRDVLDIGKARYAKEFRLQAQLFF